MIESPFHLDSLRRQIVLLSFWETCLRLDWELHAVHVRTDHSHLVAFSALQPAKMITLLKAYATKALKGRGLDLERKHRWTEGGSRRYLWNQEDIMTAVIYVVDRQGVPQEVWFKGQPSPSIAE